MGKFYYYKLTETVNDHSTHRTVDRLHYTSNNLPEEKIIATTDFDEAAAIICKHDAIACIHGKDFLCLYDYYIKKKNFKSYELRFTPIEVDKDTLTVNRLMKELSIVEFTQWYEENILKRVEG